MSDRNVFKENLQLSEAKHLPDKFGTRFFEIAFVQNCKFNFEFLLKMSFFAKNKFFSKILLTRKGNCVIIYKVREC